MQLRAIADELGIIANELDAAAAALTNQALGKSRELRAWAVRLRLQREFLSVEADLQPSLQNVEVMSTSSKRAQRLAAMAAMALASVSALADAPAAVESVQQAVSSSIEVIQEVISDSDSDHLVDVPGDPLRDGGVTESSSSALTPSTDDLWNWLRKVRARPAKFVGERSSGVCQLEATKRLASPEAVELFGPLRRGDTIELLLTNPPAGLFGLKIFANDPVASAILETHKAEYYLATMRCLGAITEHADRQTYVPALIVEQVEVAQRPLDTK